MNKLVSRLKWNAACELQQSHAPAPRRVKVAFLNQLSVTGAGYVSSRFCREVKNTVNSCLLGREEGLRHPASPTAKATAAAGLDTFTGLHHCFFPNAHKPCPTGVLVFYLKLRSPPESVCVLSPSLMMAKLRIEKERVMWVVGLCPESSLRNTEAWERRKTNNMERKLEMAHADQSAVLWNPAAAINAQGGKEPCCRRRRIEKVIKRTKGRIDIQSRNAITP
ncbi:hypothetical protein LZ30DRAFT_83927 [Colletotrichum cereale]|nr:hypothetical protein LZ30DRAFT_83927 [Colletotrichum cereale]